MSSRARRKTGSAPSGLLFSLYYSVFFAALLGGRYERKIVNYIFFDVPGDAGPVFPPAEEFSGFRPFRLRLLSFTQVLQIQLIDMLKHADAVAKLELLADPSVVRIFSLFWTRRDCFFRFGSGSAFSLCEVETVRLLILKVI